MLFFNHLQSKSPISNSFYSVKLMIMGSCGWYAVVKQCWVDYGGAIPLVVMEIFSVSLESMGKLWQ